MVQFLWRCASRLEKLGFLHKSDMYQAVDKSHTAVQGLYMTTHYEECGYGVWKTSGEQGLPTEPADQDEAPLNRPDA
jgi:hypothetical protein